MTVTDLITLWQGVNPATGTALTLIFTLGAAVAFIETALRISK